MHTFEKKYHIFLSSYNNEEPEIDTLLDKCNLHDTFIFVIKYKKYTNHNFFKKGVIREQKETLLWYKEYCANNNLKLKILIDATFEAPLYRNNLTKYCNFLIDLLDISLLDIIIFGVGEHQYEDNINFSVSNTDCIMKELFENTTATILPHHHFVSLARVAKPHRLYCTTEMIDRDLIKFGKVSLGSGFHVNAGENLILNFLPEKYLNKFPMFIDGLILGQEQYKGISPDIHGAFVNIVHETSFDESYSYMTFHNIIWHQPCITEKSIKPMAWGQIPIFIACKNHDSYMREFGFDLFDDIIDHSYNQELDPEKRIILAINSLEKLCSKPIEYWQQFKAENIQRFVKNRELSKIIMDQSTYTSANNLQKVLDNF